MATIQHTTENLVGGTVRITWANLTTTNNVGSAVIAPEHIFKEVQIKGTLGASGALDIQGALDAALTYKVINDVQGNVLTFSGATFDRIERIQESTATVRPTVTAGDGTTSLTVTMILKTPNQSDS